MTNYDDGDKDRNGDENEERNDDNNVASGSWYDGPIFDPITTTWSHGRGLDNDSDGWYGHGALYIYHFKDVTLSAVCEIWHFGLV